MERDIAGTLYLTRGRRCAAAETMNDSMLRARARACLEWSPGRSTGRLARCACNVLISLVKTLYLESPLTSNHHCIRSGRRLSLYRYQITISAMEAK